jgi:PHD/YefM family antitoxin component YafN of YafNO toxin-antitoxin module
MNQLQTEPITQLQRNYNVVLDRLPAGPVMLLQRSALAAVMVSPEQWNAMTAELDRLRRIVIGDQHFADMRAGQYTTELPA